MIACRESDLLNDSAQGPQAHCLRAFCFLCVAQELQAFLDRRTTLVRLIFECFISVHFPGLQHTQPHHTVRGITYHTVIKQICLCGTGRALSRLRCICTESAEQILKK